MNRFKEYIRDQQFNPKILGIFINPFYLVRRKLRGVMVLLSDNIKGQTLDVGCGEKPYEKIFKNVSSYTGIEFDSLKNRAKFKKIDAWYDGQTFPFDDNKFDSIIMTQVLEHIFNPDHFLEEVRRVTKSGGSLLLSVPFVWDEHEQPHDYARYSSFGLAHLLQNHGFEIKKQLKSSPDVGVIFQLMACYIHKRLSWIKSYKIRLILYIFLISPFTVLSIILSKILPKNQDLYMDSIVLARKI